MKHKVFLIAILITAVTAGIFAQGYQGGGRAIVRADRQGAGRAGAPGDLHDGDLAGVILDFPRGELDQAEIDGLLLMREEEKLARDVYLTLADEWNIRSFENIARSEETHMDAVGLLLERYGIDDPVRSDKVGAFTSVEMSTLYDELVGLGMDSYSDALKVGAKIEELDIADLLSLIDSTDNDDLKVVYQNLLKGSRNHLRAFDMKIQRDGESYSPEFLAPDEYERIVSSPREMASVITDPEYLF